jgi:exopolyphosphatase/pppGpp-phosphohydrolase
VNPDAGGLTIHISDRSTAVAMTGGGEWSMPIGPLSLVENELERADRPAPAQLTNALGLVSDHFDDIILDAPIVASAPSALFTGPHSMTLARVELGVMDIPDDYTLRRSDADEVFRTLVAEPIEDRLANPGLDPAHVEAIIGTCCVVLAVIRRLDLQHVGIGAHATPTPTGDA